MVAGGEAHAVQAAFLQAHEVAFPAADALPVGQFHAEHLAPAVPADAEADQRGALWADAIFVHAFVAGIGDEAGKLFVQSAAHEVRQLLVEFLVDVTDRRGAELVPAECFGDRLHPAGRHALPLDLHERGHEGLLAALVACAQLGRESALPVLRDPQLELAHAGHQRAGLVSPAIAESAGAAFAFAGEQRLFHLRFQHFLQGNGKKSINRRGNRSDVGKRKWWRYWYA